MSNRRSRPQLGSLWSVGCSEMTLWWALERLDGPDDPDGSPSPPVGAPLELLEGTACDRGVLAGVAVAAATGSLST